MGSIRENIDAVNRIKGEAAVKSGRKAEDVLLCAVTKTRTADEINEAIDAGITDIGENKVQEIMDKSKNSGSTVLTPLPPHGKEMWGQIHCHYNRAQMVLRFPLLLSYYLPTQ